MQTHSYGYLGQFDSNYIGEIEDFQYWIMLKFSEIKISSEIFLLKENEESDGIFRNISFVEVTNILWYSFN
jgi:hypothetical protein